MDETTATAVNPGFSMPDIEAAMGRAFESSNSPFQKLLDEINEANKKADVEVASVGQLVSDLDEAVDVFRRSDGGKLTPFSIEEARTELETAEMGAALLAPLTRPLNSILPGVKIGSIVLGGGIGLITGEVIDGVTPPRNAAGNMNVANILFRVGIGAALVQFGDQVMTRDTRNAVIVVLATQTLADFLPVDVWVNRILSWIPGRNAGNTGTMAQRQVRQQQRASTEQSFHGPGGDELANILG